MHASPWFEAAHNEQLVGNFRSTWWLFTTMLHTGASQLKEVNDMCCSHVLL